MVLNSSQMSELIDKNAQKHSMITHSPQWQTDIRTTGKSAHIAIGAHK